MIPEVNFEDGYLCAENACLLQKLPKNLAAAATSVKLKLSEKAVEVEIKLCDKFKALEMYRQLLASQSNDGNNNDEHLFSVAYEYVSQEIQQNDSESE